MFVIAFFVGLFSAVFIQIKMLDILEWLNCTHKTWHLLHIIVNAAIGISLVFLFWSWIVGGIGVGFISIGLASLYKNFLNV